MNRFDESLFLVIGRGILGLVAVLVISVFFMLPAFLWIVGGHVTGRDRRAAAREPIWYWLCPRWARPSWPLVRRYSLREKLRFAFNTPIRPRGLSEHSNGT